MRIAIRLEWDMGHRLPNHGGQCFNLHGHRYAAEFMVDGEIMLEKGEPAEGMVVDFSDVKMIAKDEVKRLDHRFMLAESDPFLLNSSRLVLMNLGIIVVPYIPTAENIATDLLARCRKSALDHGFDHVIFSMLRLWETPTSWVEAT
jgi:6-pyruvoyltetrahydropterin/6-carboxytetrahydropterin synthase